MNFSENDAQRARGWVENFPEISHAEEDRRETTGRRLD
jgi:hypothetical protein